MYHSVNTCIMYTFECLKYIIFQPWGELKLILIMYFKNPQDWVSDTIS